MTYIELQKELRTRKVKMTETIADILRVAKKPMTARQIWACLPDDIRPIDTAGVRTAMGFNNYSWNENSACQYGYDFKTSVDRITEYLYRVDSDKCPIGEPIKRTVTRQVYSLIDDDKEELKEYNIYYYITDNSQKSYFQTAPLNYKIKAIDEQKAIEIIQRMYANNIIIIDIKEI